MYKKLITPALALACLSFSAGFLPIAHAAESLPGIVHREAAAHLSAIRASSTVPTNTAAIQAAVRNSEAISAPADVKIDFERSLVTSQAAPLKPTPVETPAAPAANNPDLNYLATANDGSDQTDGLAPWQISQLNAQKNYMATMLQVPFAVNPPAQPKAAEIVKIAKAHLGVPYVWGGVSPVDGWDCSGYVQWVFGQVGIKLPRVSQWVNETKIDPKDAQPGDLVVQDNGTHVGIYIGNGQMYSALNPSVGTLEHSTSIMKADYYRIG
jgi:peptidoglycan DL-endopeptidase CwlO